MKAAFRFIALAAAVGLLITGCADSLLPDGPAGPAGDRLVVTLSFAPANEAPPAAESSSARTLLPDFAISNAAYVTVQVFDPATNSELEASRVTQADLTQSTQVSMNLPSVGPWTLKATLYGSDKTTVVATGTKFSFLFYQSAYCTIPIEPPSTAGGTGSLRFSLYFANLPVPLSSVTTTLVPLTVEAGSIVKEGDPINLSTFRTDDISTILLVCNPLPSGNYRLRASFIHDNREFRVSGIDQVIRICDGFETLGSASFNYYDIVFEPTMTFTFTPYNPSAIAGQRAFVLVWTKAQYEKTTADGTMTLYETPYASAPIGMGIVNLDTETGAGSVTILDKDGKALQFTRGERYYYRVVVDTSDRYKDYTSFGAITHPEAIVGDTGDYCAEDSFTKLNMGEWSVDPSSSSQTTAIFFVSATGAGSGKTYEDACSWASLGSQNLNNAQLYLATDIDVSAGLTVPGSGLLSVWSIGAPKAIRTSGVMSGSVFTVQNGGNLGLFGVGIDGTNATAMYSPAIVVGQNGNLTMDSGSFVQAVNLSGGDGAAVSIFNGSASISYTKFTGNTAAAGNGGALAITGDGAVSSNVFLHYGVSFTGNTASNGTGGALFVGESGNAYLSFLGSYAETCMVMTDNHALGALGAGGGIYVDAGGSLSGPSPWLNAASGYGYASLCTGNTATEAAAANYVNNGAYTDTY